MKWESRRNIYQVILLGLVLILNKNCTKEEDPDILTDIDGNRYHILFIGEQAWLGENLKVTHYNDGTQIPYVIHVEEWNNLTAGACCDYNNVPGNSKIYGNLYNYYAVTDPKKICPVGWHVPTNTEWEALIDFLGGEDVAGGKLKESGTAHWLSQNSDATDEVGFTALPGGQRSIGSDEGYFDNGYVGYWWSSDVHESFPNLAFAWILMINNPGLTNSLFNKTAGISVRCIKDN